MHQQLAKSHFEDVDLTGSQFVNLSLRDSRFRCVEFAHVVMRGCEMSDVDIHGEIHNVKINEVDIGPLVEAELDRRYPGRAKMRPITADGFRDAWDLLEQLWEETVERARGMEPSMLHESVDGEWSFIETLRHLVFATDSWVRRAMLGDPSPWHALALPWDEMPDTPGVPRDREASPSLDEVLELRHDRMATVRKVLAELTDKQLASGTTPVVGVGWPEPRSYPVSEVLLCILNEEWEHRLYAERDLSLLADR